MSSSKPPPPVTLERAYSDAALPLARLLPEGERVVRGLHASFAALDRLCAHLEGLELDGALVLRQEGVVVAVTLLFEGHLVSANASKLEESLWGDAALLELDAWGSRVAGCSRC
ncbi:MAG: hypothetical protein HC933_15930 [Pleurocapsa sp. SU_196_0]|nr:hypothetical protein [Pleurocapsa sp. SU_196_0]